MSTPEGSRGPSPLRVGGLALIGVGAVAGLIGLATLLPGGSGSGTAAPTTTSQVAPTTEPVVTAAPTATTAVPVPAFTTAPAPVPVPAPGAPGGPATAGGGAPAGTGTGGTAGSGGGGGTPAVKSQLRVYNNSTITGLAGRAADDFRAEGWKVEAVANYPEGRIPTSTVYYRPGTSEQSSAASLAQAFGLRVEPRFAGLTDASPGLIVIVTNDYQKR